MAKIQRMVPLADGKRLAVKLDESNWQAIDWLSSQHGITWQEWCVDAIQQTPGAENATGAIRDTAMAQILKENVFTDREAQLAAMEMHPLLKDSGTLDDGQLADILKKARVAGRSNFGGFEVLFGLDEHAQDCVWIKNGLRDGLHFAFVLPVNGGQP